MLSGVAAYYSVAGLVAVFSAATVPVIIMGGSLELGKIAATVWLHNNWRRAGWAFKLYLVPAVTFLMLLTSMGIFGYLSKAHSDQSLVSGDAVARVAIFDEKLKTERDNIESNRRTLRQLDEAVDQLVGRSKDERGVERSVQIRRNQQAERTRLAREIETSQRRIAELNEQRAPLAAAVRQVEAEVGPIKYIAALIYGDNPDQNTLERAVRFMIIMIVLVFDPLALTLILAANKQFAWARQGRGGWSHEDAKYEPDNGALTDQQIQQVQQQAPTPKDSVTKTQLFEHQPDSPVNEQTHPYLFKGNFWKKPQGWITSGPMVATPVNDLAQGDDDDDQETDPSIKSAIKRWKQANPDSTLKEERRKFARGQTQQLPWLDSRYFRPNFGPRLPSDAERGDVFVRTDRIPSVLHKYTGSEWIVIDKNNTDNYTYDKAYIDYLIDKVATGEYDPDLLSDAERDSMTQRLNSTNKPTNETN